MNKSALYSNAIVKTLEDKLLNPGRVSRMIAADSIQDAAAVLYECGYDGDIIARTTDNADALADAELQKTVVFFKKMCVDSNLSRVAVRRFDYHNLKVLQREKYGEEGANAALYSFAGIPPEKMRQIVKEETYNDFPPAMAEACRMIKRLFASGEHLGKLVDITLDIAMYNETAAYVKKIKNAYARQYFACEADLWNICSAAKMRQHGFAREALDARLVSGGNLDNSKYYALLENAPEDAVQAFVSTGYHGLVKELAAGIAADRPLSDFEARAAEFLFGLSRLGKDDYFDSSPLFCWYIEKLEEIKTVRLILNCKKAGVDGGVIRARLMPFYTSGE